MFNLSREPLIGADFLQRVAAQLDDSFGVDALPPLLADYARRGTAALSQRTATALAWTGAPPQAHLQLAAQVCAAALRESGASAAACAAPIATTLFPQLAPRHALEIASALTLLVAEQQ